MSTTPLLKLALLVIVMGWTAPWVRGEELLLRQGDRIVLLGGSYVEQMQGYGFLEAILQARYPELKLSLRNLGWSGDNASGMARKVFGEPAQGLARLKRDLEFARPTMVIVAYGTSEALDGNTAAVGFEPNLKRLLEFITQLQAKAILVQPYRMSGARRADYGQSLSTVRATLARTASELGLPLVDLQPAIESSDLLDGLQPSELGHWKIARQIADEIAPGRSEVTLRWTAEPGDLAGAVRRKIRLPEPSSPAAASAPIKLIAEKLTKGRYRVRCEGWHQDFDETELAAGVMVPAKSVEQAMTALRQHIIDKNALFFHRYRPQNETYLFLFRKHEQGQNAVEIPQFDALVEAADREIQRLASVETDVQVKIEALSEG